MKLLIISDIHGITNNLEYIENLFITERFDKLVVLGDLYYIGPRNTMTDNYDINEVNSFLTRYKEKLICLQGNCDSSVDKLISNFIIIPEIEYLSIDNLNIYLSHGHIYNESNALKLPDESILIYGHEHIPFCKNTHNKYFLNPGSISLPKMNFKPSYLVYNNREFKCFDIEGELLYSLKLEQ